MLETPSDLAIKISLLHDEVDSDGTFSPPIRRIEQLVAVRDAEVRKECADRAVTYCKKWAEFPIGNHGLGALRAAIMGEQKE